MYDHSNSSRDPEMELKNKVQKANKKSFHSEREQYITLNEKFRKKLRQFKEREPNILGDGSSSE